MNFRNRRRVLKRMSKWEQNLKDTEPPVTITHVTNTLTITSVVNTCEACPSQWDIQLSDRTLLYVRYRWGHFSVNRMSFEGKIEDLLYETYIGNEYDGYMDENTMRDLVNNNILEKS